MGSAPSLLVKGNAKLGDQIHQWSLPAVTTCPGRSGLCEGCCYARQGRFLLAFVRDRLEENLRLSRLDDFAERMIREVKRRWVQVCRVHVSGDFYDAGYAAKWLAICRACPRTRFFAYTRSWRVEAIEPVLRELALLRNVRLWYSADSETGVPESVPAHVRVAWLQDEAGETGSADLVFLVRRLRKDAPAELGEAMVCPNERQQATQDITCATCRHCWK